MTISRALHESEIMVGIIAGQHAAAQVMVSPPPLHSPDIRLAVGTAERICEEIIQRADNPERMSELDPGIVFIDEFSSAANDGSDRRAGIHVEWKRGEQIGPEGNTLTPNQVNELFGVIVEAVEQWGEQYGSSFTVLYDRD